MLLGALYVFFALTPAMRGRVRHLALTLALVLAEVAIWPVMLRLARHSNTGQSCLVWRLFRRSNHETWFYFYAPAQLDRSAVLLAALAGLIWLRREATWRERMLLAWVVVPVLFFTLWPVKGFQYLLPIAPALASPRRPGAEPPASAAPRDGRQGRDGRRGHGGGRQPGGPGVGAEPAVVQHELPGRQRRHDRRPGGRNVDPPAMCRRAAGCWLSARPPPTCWSTTGTAQVSALSVSTNPRDRRPVLRSGSQPRSRPAQRRLPVRRLGRLHGGAQSTSSPRRRSG